MRNPMWRLINWLCDRQDAKIAKAGFQTSRTRCCTYCGDYVADWVDPDWAKGRICRKCESKYRPDSE